MEQLFREMDEAIQGGEHEKVVGVCDKVLATNPNDSDAIRCKAVALLKLNRNEEALKTASSSPGAVTEHAYALYRLKRFTEAYSVLEKHQQQHTATALCAQVAFRTERFSDAARIYESLMSGKGGGQQHYEAEEVRANLIAAHVEAGEREKCAGVTRTATPETAFNTACYHCQCGEWAAAKAALSAAAAAAAAADESALGASVAAMGAYVEAVAAGGDRAAAEAAFEGVQQRARKESETAAVAANNVAALRAAAGRDFFGSLRMLRAAAPSGGAADQRLSSRQRASVALNKALLALRQGAPQKEVDADLASASVPSSSSSSAVVAAVVSALAAPSPGERAARLAAFRARAGCSAEADVLAAFAHAAVLAEGGLSAAAADVLESGLPAAQWACRAGVCAAVAALRDRAGDAEGAARALEECAARNSKKKGSGSGSGSGVAVCRRAAEALQRRGLHERASAIFEALASESSASVDPSRVEALAFVNVSRAEALCKSLPPMPTPPVSIETLESLSSSSAAAITTATAKAAEERGKEEKQEKKRRRRRSKRKRLPKDMEAAVDPERWVAKEQRSTFRQSKQQQRQRSRHERQKQKQRERAREKSSLLHGLPGAQDADAEQALGTRTGVPPPSSPQAAAAAAAAASASKGGRHRRPKHKF